MLGPARPTAPSGMAVARCIQAPPAPAADKGPRPADASAPAPRPLLAWSRSSMMGRSTMESTCRSAAEGVAATAVAAAPPPALLSAACRRYTTMGSSSWCRLASSRRVRASSSGVRPDASRWLRSARCSTRSWHRPRRLAATATCKGARPALSAASTAAAPSGRARMAAATAAAPASLSACSARCSSPATSSSGPSPQRRSSERKAASLPAEAREQSIRMMSPAFTVSRRCLLCAPLQPCAAVGSCGKRG
mmetsp:Transcript_43371/g.137971  ORF Transcript_43371/g.137971 Transcript_43371/m.137971 type:complete len:250 (-) Transcript_43371:609-1358(-)